MLPSSSRGYGMLFIGLGVWVAILALALYSKFERQQKGDKNPSAYLIGFLAISAAALAVGLYVANRKKDSSLSAGMSDSPFVE